MGQLRCSFPDYYLRHVVLILLQCILDFIPCHCPFLSSYLCPHLADGVSVPVRPLLPNAYLCSLFLHSCARLCLRVHGHVSPCLHSSFMSPSQTPSPRRRLNSRDRIRMKLSPNPKDGMMITFSKFSAGPNPGTDNTGTQQNVGMLNFAEVKTESTLPHSDA